MEKNPSEKSEKTHTEALASASSAAPEPLQPSAGAASEPSNVAHLIADLPAPTVDPAKKTPNDEKEGLPVDLLGKPYDPATHEVSPQTGKARKKRRGGKVSGSKVRTKPAASVIGNPEKEAARLAAEQQEAEQVRATTEALGRVTVATMTGALCAVFQSDEWRPEKRAEYDEEQALVDAFAAYYAATGKTEMSPGMGLAIGLLGYGMARMNKPKTRSTLARAKDWAASKYLSWRGRRSSKKARTEDSAEPDEETLSA